MFAPLPSKFDFPAAEKVVLEFWEKHGVFEASLRQREGAPRFVFYEGPPTANGLPHPGHCLTRAIKDLFPRYRTMRGFLCERKAGWDTHGLPVEVEVCKELTKELGRSVHTKQEIEEYGVEKFVHRCITSVWRYTREWEELTRRLGFWVNLQDAYATYHQSYVESVWWSLKTLFERGLLYQGHKVVWWWAQGGTALSAGEVGEGYRPVDDPSVFVKFPLLWGRSEPDADVSSVVWETIQRIARGANDVSEDSRIELSVAFATVLLNLPRALISAFDGPGEIARELDRRGEDFIRKLFAPRSLLVWTTTPWTLVSNHFAAVHPDLEYTLVYDADNGESLFIASDLVETIAKKVKRELEPLGTYRGESLLGLLYLPPFRESFYDLPFKDFPGLPTRAGMWDSTDTVLGRLEADRLEGGAQRIGWRVLAADFVTIDSGTGLVHEAPAFGEVDFNLLQKERERFEERDAIPLLCAVNPDGTFNADAPERYRGRWVKECDKDIIRELKERKTPWGTPLLYHQETYRHDYPFCPRAENDPLIQYARKSWFVRTSQFKDEFIRNNAAVNWLPEHIKEGRFGDFLRNNVDWALSRERYWGTPLPIWACEKCGKMEALGSFAKLQAKPGATDGGYWERKVAEHRAAGDAEMPSHLRVHKPYIDEWTYRCAHCEETGNSEPAAGSEREAPASAARMRRVPEVIDCWWDAGSMPFAQWGYPHAPGSIDRFFNRFPADFISEALDQTRGWFYGLLAISTLLFSKTEDVFEHGKRVALKHAEDVARECNLAEPDVPPFCASSFSEFVRRRDKQVSECDTPHERNELRWQHVCTCDPADNPNDERGVPYFVMEDYPLPYRTCICLGLILGEDGTKMSKRLKNYREPTYIFDAYGADAMRWFFFSAQAPWTSVRFQEAALRDAQREFLVKLYNVLSFFNIYANIDGFGVNSEYRTASNELNLPAAGASELVTRSSLLATFSGLGWRPPPRRSELDRWILSELHRTILFVRDSMDRFENYPAANRLNDFVDALSNWYVRRSRERFWRPVENPQISQITQIKEKQGDQPGRPRAFTQSTPSPTEREARTGAQAPAVRPLDSQSVKSVKSVDFSSVDQDKWDAYNTLYECLLTLSQLIAPFTPFFAETMYQNLRGAEGSRGQGAEGTEPAASSLEPSNPRPLGPSSVHLCDYPEADESLINEELSAEMDLVREIASLGRAARAAATVKEAKKVRQPLARVELVLARPEHHEWLESHRPLIAEELNVKAVDFVTAADQYVTYKVVPNFAVIGKKFRGLAQQIKPALEKLPDPAAALRKMSSAGKLTLDVAGQTVELTPEEVEIRLEAKPGWSAAQGRVGVVVLSTELTPELREEGLIRELIHHVQGLRKEANLPYHARIRLAIAGDEPLLAVVRRHEAAIRGECLADRVETVAGGPALAGADEIDLEGHAVRLALQRVA